MKVSSQATAAINYNETEYRTVMQKSEALTGLGRETVSAIQTGIQSKAFSARVLDKASKVVSDALSSTNTRVEFSVFKPTQEVVMKIKDSGTGKVIRQIPSKKDLEMAVYMRKLAGIIVDARI